MRVFILQPAPSPARRNCLNYLTRCPDGMVVEIRPNKAKRSAEQNRRYWAILNQVSEDAWLEGRQYSSDIWHEFMKRRFIGQIDGPGGISIAEASSKLNTAEFAHYCEMVEVFAATDLGITLTENIEPMGRVG